MAVPAPQLTSKPVSAQPQEKADAAKTDGALIWAYSLSESEARTLTARLLARQPPTSDSALVLYLLPGTDELSNLGRHVELQVFASSFGSDGTSLSRYYGSHEIASSFLLVVDREAVKAVGVMRLVRNNPSAGAGGFITTRDLSRRFGVTAEQVRARHGVEELDRVWEIASQAVLRAYRALGDHLVSNMLYRALFLRVAGARVAVSHIVAVVDSEALRVLRALGLPFVPICGTAPFECEGSPESTAVIGRWAEFGPAARRTRDTARDGRARAAADLFVRRAVLGEEVDYRLMFPFSAQGLLGEGGVVDANS